LRAAARDFYCGAIAGAVDSLHRARLQIFQV